MLPGFHAEATLNTSVGPYRSLALHGQRLHSRKFAPAAVHVWTGHCGCYADQWWGLPCVCVDVTPDPPPIVPVPAWEYQSHDAGAG
jgi:hypothetical protein